VDNFVGKPVAGPLRARKFKGFDRMLNSWAGKIKLKFKRLLMCDSAMTLEIGLRASIGAAVDFSGRASLGFARD